MAIAVYPSMTTSGFITTPSLKAEAILTDYIGTNYSQSNTFLGHLKSLAQAIQNNPNNMVGVSSQVTNDLNNLYGSYLDNVHVNVTTEAFMDENGATNDSRYDLQIEVIYDDNGTRQSLCKSISVDNQMISKIAKLERRL